MISLFIVKNSSNTFMFSWTYNPHSFNILIFELLSKSQFANAYYCLIPLHFLPVVFILCNPHIKTFIFIQMLTCFDTLRFVLFHPLLSWYIRIHFHLQRSQEFHISLFYFYGKYFQNLWSNHFFCFVRFLS